MLHQSYFIDLSGDYLWFKCLNKYTETQHMIINSKRFTVTRLNTVRFNLLTLFNALTHNGGAKSLLHI